MAAEAQEPPSFSVSTPGEPITPVVLTVPHAGREYPAALLANSRLGADALMALEDRHMDRLVALAAAEGASVVIARRARAWIDLNRDPREIDPAMVTPPPRRETLIETAKLRGGLGLLPRRVPGRGEIARRPISAEALAERIARDHLPYHLAVAELLERARVRFGRAVLIDCHSMPPLEGPEPAQVVLGDRGGRSATRDTVARAAAAARPFGLRLGVNQPYSGGYTLDRHGRPWRSVEALQVEIDRALYLDPALEQPGPGVATMAALIAAIARALAAEPMAAAAE